MRFPLYSTCCPCFITGQRRGAFIYEGLSFAGLWATPAGMASVAFHLQHLTGVLDRLFTYAKGLPLTDAQLSYLSVEGKETDETDLDTMLQSFIRTIDKSVSDLSGFDEKELTAIRYVGRKKLPSTVIGLLFHAAEHTMRHTGQLLVTVSWVKSI